MLFKMKKTRKTLNLQNQWSLIVRYKKNQRRYEKSRGVQVTKKKKKKKKKKSILKKKK